MPVGCARAHFMQEGGGIKVLGGDVALHFVERDVVTEPAVTFRVEVVCMHLQVAGVCSTAVFRNRKAVLWR